MNKFIPATAIVLAVAGGVAIGLPALVPVDVIEKELAAQVKAATGRDLLIKGALSVSAFPELALDIGDLTLSSPPGFTARNLLHLDKLRLKLRLLPLLSGRVEIDEFILTGPKLTLETDRKGRGNWDFAAGDADESVKSEKQTSEPVFDHLALKALRIEKGALSYTDQRTGFQEQAEAVDLALSLAGPDKPLTAQGGVAWRGKPVQAKLDVAQPGAFADGHGTKAAVTVTADGMTVTLDGQAVGGASPGFDGVLTLAAPSLRRTIGWLSGKEPDLGLNSPLPLAATGKLSAAPARLTLTDAEIAFNGIKAQAGLTVTTSGPRPQIRGMIDFAALDLTSYLPASQSAEAKPAAAGWSGEPIDLSALGSVDADLRLSADSVTLQSFKAGRTALHAFTEAGRLTATLSESRLYRGTARGRVQVDDAQPGLGLAADLAVEGLALGPLLTDAADFKRLEGTGKADLHVAGRGKSLRGLIASLEGKGSVVVTDGAITGINLAALLRNAASGFTIGDMAQKTDFAELDGSFAISQGILANKDLSLKSPLLRLTGAGTVDLPQRRLDYRIEPKAAATLEGQGSRTDAAGLMVPVVVEGPWDSLSWHPDLASAVKDRAGAALNGALPADIGTLLGR